MRKFLKIVAFCLVAMLIVAVFGGFVKQNPKTEITKIRTLVDVDGGDTAWEAHLTVEGFVGSTIVDVPISREFKSEIEILLKKEKVVGHVTQTEPLLIKESDLKEMLRIKNLPPEAQATLGASGE